MKTLTLLVPTVVEAAKAAMREAREHPMRALRLSQADFQKSRKGINGHGQANVARMVLNRITRNMKRKADIRRHRSRIAAVNVQQDINRGRFTKEGEVEARDLIARLTRKPTHEKSNAPKMTGISRKAAHLGAKEDDHKERVKESTGMAIVYAAQTPPKACPPIRIRSSYLQQVQRGK